MAKSMGKTIANIVILSAITLSCAATAIGIYAMNRNAEVDPSSSSIGGGTKDPRSITKIEKTNTLGLIDEYTITYTDNTTSTFFVTNGKDGTEGIQGLPGADGHTPTITVGTNGNWVIDGVDLGIRAEGLRGPQGEAGRGIVSINKTSTSGQIDEYTITYTDNTTSTFVVTNGTNGEQGIQGLPGTNGHTPTIEIGTNGNWYVDGTDTGIHATGPAGANGKSAYEIAVDNGYPGTETEWLLSLIGAAGAVGPAGPDGKSAYEIAVENGYPGTEAEWLESLIGQNGNNGMSAYQLYCESHIDPDLSEPDWIASLYGKSAYDIYCSVNPDPDMSESDWLASLVGADGSDGRGIASITGPVPSGSYDTYTINYTDGSTPTEFIVRHGTDGNDGASLLTGADNPLPAVGNSGDSYINTTTWEYFTKNGNTWTSKGSIRGTDGSNGSNGIDGTDGKTLLTGDGVPSAAANAGDSYIDLSSCDYYIYNGTSWDLVANIKGETGKGITTIALTDSSEANRDQYTITYSDGTSFSYYVAKPRSILSIAKTGESDLVDTYTITYSYGETSTFTVTNGEDGRTIYHGETAPDDAIGNQNDVYIDTHNLNMYFKGISSWGTPISFKGTDGVGISTIAKTGTADLVDTYTVTYTNGNIFNFTVTNGADGKDGTKVVTGTVAPSSKDGFQEGDSYINTTNWDYYVLVTNASEELEWELRGNIRGAAGADGANGQDGTKLRVGNAAPTDTTGYQEGDSYLDTSTWNFYVLTKDGENNLVWGSPVGNIHNAPTTYTVSFESNGGTAVDSIDNALEGKTIARPSNPTKSGYFFEGWYTEDGTRWDFYKDIVTADITLLARWGQLKVVNGELKECTLTGDIEIPYSYNDQVITSIDASAFSGNTDISSITLPNSITTLPSAVFSGCTNLREIVLPKSLTSIPANAFDGCSSLRAVVLPNTVTTIGRYAFNDCTNLEYVTYPSDTSLVEIKNYAFQNSGLKQFVIPSNVMEVGEGCFKDCNQMNAITLPKVNYNDQPLAYIFNGLTAPSSLETIVYTGDETIAVNTFTGFSSVKALVIEGDAMVENTGLDGLSNLENLSLYTLGDGSENHNYLGYVFANTGDAATNCNSSVPASLRSVSIRSGNIDSYAFENCAGLKEITIPDSVTEIGQYAFKGCSALTNFNLPSGLTSIGDHAFEGCSGLKVIVIPASVDSLGSYAFSGCSSLTSISLSSTSLTAISDHAFYQCSSLANLSLPDSVTGLEEYAFAGCSSLTSFTSSTIRTLDSYVFSGCSGLKTVSLTSSYLDAIPDHAFYQCTDLLSINLTYRIVSVGDYAFADCFSFVNFGLGKPNPGYTDKFTTVGNYAFSNCYSLPFISLPSKSIKTIGNYAFHNCYSLISIANLDNASVLTSIGSSAFENCRSLNNLFIKVSSTLTIGNYCFDSCNSMKTVKFIGNGTLVCGDLTFQACVSLTEVEFGEDLSGLTLGQYQFNNCKSLVEVRHGFTELAIPTSCFQNCFALKSVRSTASGAYTGIKTIGNNAFSGCSSLEQFDFHGVEAIGSSAFQGCTSLQSVYLYDNPNLTTIKISAFRDCTSLTSVRIPASVTTIERYVFNNCTSLETVTMLTLENPPVHIERFAFQGCTSLTTFNVATNNTTFFAWSIASDNGPLSAGTVTVNYGYVEP